MKKIYEKLSIKYQDTLISRIFWDRKLENKVQDYLDNLLKRIQEYH